MNVKIKDKCVCVTSGGMDSISMALKMYHDGYDITLFHIDLNQKSEAREHIAVQIIAEALDVRYKFINCHWLGELGGSSLTDEDIGIPEGMDSMEESLNINERNEPGLWTPARNVVLLAAAAAYGERFGAKLITFGANQSECCLPKGSNILLSSKKELDVSKINVGDILMSWNEKDNKVEGTKVVKNFKRSDSVANIKLSSKVYKPCTIQATLNHPFFIKNRGWVQVKDINVGDVIHTYHELSQKDRSLHNNCMDREDVKKKHLETVQSDEYRTKMSKIVFNYSKEVFKKRSMTMKKNFTDPEFKKKYDYEAIGKKISESLKKNESVKGSKNPMYGHVRSNTVKCWCGKIHRCGDPSEALLLHYKEHPETREAVSNASKSLHECRRKEGTPHWNTKEVNRKKISKGVLKALDEGRGNPALGGISKPTGLEKRFIQLFKKHNLLFKYVGDGQVWITAEGKHMNPDFINSELKKVIEVWNPYWHTDEEMDEKARLFGSMGWECLLIKEEELKDIDVLLGKLNGFCAMVSNGMVVEGIEVLDEVVDVYNIHCEPNNNFFVNKLLCHNSYPDNTMEFADRFTHMLKYGCLKPLIVTAPLYEMDKVQLIKWGCDNGYKKIYNHTWSCDDGQDIPCGVCGCCCNRRLAYYILGSIYGTDIEDYMDGQKYIDEAYFTDIFLPKASSIRKGFWWEKYSTCL